MSHIPSSAMPHAYADEQDDQSETQSKVGPSAGLLIGGAVAVYLLYRFLR